MRKRKSCEGTMAVLRRFVVLLVCAAAPGTSATQQPAGRPPVVDPVVGDVPGIEVAEPSEGTVQSTGKRVTPLIVPMPFRNTQIGWGLLLMLGAIHRFDMDTTVKPSTGAVGGFYSENGSWGVTALEMARLGRDRWRLRGLVSHLDVRYDFYGIGEEAGSAGRALPIDQAMNFATGSALVRVTRGVYLGPQVLWVQSIVRLRDTAGPGFPRALEDTSRTTLFAPGLLAELDTRDNDCWPTSGSLANVRALFFTSALGGS